MNEIKHQKFLDLSKLLERLVDMDKGSVADLKVDTYNCAGHGPALIT
jgi:hypothetical protein